MSDIYLRHEFPPPGQAKAARPGDTPTDRYNNAIAALSAAQFFSNQSSGRTMGAGGAVCFFQSARPPTRRIPGETSRNSSTARARPRSVFTGSCAFS